MIARCRYDDHTLRRLLDQPMAPSDADLLAHVESCDACQSQLEMLSQEGLSWEAAGKLLRDDTFDSDVLPAVSDVSTDAQQLLLDPSDHPESLGRIGRYEIMEILGRGGMGVVMRGYDPALNRHSAIKVLAPEYSGNAAARRRFAREAKSAAAVVHPHVVPIQTVDQQRGVPYLVMPVIEGRSLQHRVQTEGPLETIEIVRIAAQVADGLAAAHAQGLVHRDIKPGNILLENGVERVQITDFGLARAIDDASMTRSGIIAGTPQYMSPEQAHGDAIDHRSDLFSLGSLIYFMASGRSPFRAETTMGVLNRIGHDEPRRLRSVNSDIPLWLEDIVNQLLQKNPEKRIQSAKELADLLNRWLAHLQDPDAVHPPSQPVTRSEQTKRFRWGRLLAGCLFGGVLILLGIVVYLETSEGTLKIESNADVPIRIRQGEETVKTLTVSPGNNTTAIKAGKYILEIEGDSSEYEIVGNEFRLRRGGEWTAKITRRSPPETKSVKSKPQRFRELIDGTRATADELVQKGDDDERSFSAILEQYNNETQAWRDKFDPPIPAMTMDQLKHGFAEGVKSYRKAGEAGITLLLAVALQREAIGKSLQFYVGGTQATSKEDGEVAFKQIVPAFVADLGDHRPQLSVTLNAIGLRYSRDGYSSKTYGDIHPPLDGTWKLVEAEQAGQSVTGQALSDWIAKNPGLGQVVIYDDQLVMPMLPVPETLKEDETRKTFQTFDLKLDYEEHRFVASRGPVVVWEGLFMSNAYVDNTKLTLVMSFGRGPVPESFNTEGTKNIKLTYRRVPLSEDQSQEETPKRSPLTITPIPQQPERRMESPEFPPVTVSVLSENGDPLPGAEVELNLRSKNERPIEATGTSLKSGVAIDRVLPYGEYSLYVKTEKGWYMHDHEVKVEFGEPFDLKVVAPDPAGKAKIEIQGGLPKTPTAALNQLPFGGLEYHNSGIGQAFYPQPVPKPREEAGKYKSFPTWGNGVEDIGLIVRPKLTRETEQPNGTKREWQWGSLSTKYLLTANGLRPWLENLQSESASPNNKEGYFVLDSPGRRVPRVRYLKLKLGPPKPLPETLEVPTGQLTFYINGLYGRPTPKALEALGEPDLVHSSDENASAKTSLWLSTEIPKDSPWIPRLIDPTTADWKRMTGGGLFHLLRLETTLKPGSTLTIPIKPPKESTDRESTDQATDDHSKSP